MLLPENIKNEVRERFKELEGPVRIVNFTQRLECQFCSETRQLMEEVAELSDLITLEVLNFQVDSDRAREMGIDKIPATVVTGSGEKEYGVRFFGIPSGYEFSTLVEAIVSVSTGDSGLKQSTRERLAELDTPIHLQVFVTPT